jgi:hypothetical protein
MDIDTADAERNRANADFLSTVESEIVSLEQMFSRLESLKTERDRLSSAVQSLTADETRTLADDASESVVVKKLLEIRGRKDVQSARLVSTEGKIAEQTDALSVQGANVRRSFQVVVGRLWLSRDARVIEALVELFGAGWIVLRDGKRLEMKHLARQTKLMKEMRDLDNKVSHPISDSVQETAALQRSRTWLDEIRSLVEHERGLTLMQPEPLIEEPAREMVEA